MPVFPLQSSPGSCPVWRSGFSRSFHTNSQESKRVNGLPEIFIPDSASLIVLHIYCKYKSIGVTANGTFFFTSDSHAFYHGKKILSGSTYLTFLC